MTALIIILAIIAAIATICGKIIDYRYKIELANKCLNNIAKGNADFTIKYSELEHRTFVNITGRSIPDIVRVLLKLNEEVRKQNKQ